MNDLFRHSGGSVLVRPAGSKITLHDIASKGATGELHKTFIQLCDEEISKLYLGSTLTVEVGDKGTQALGNVHQEGQEDVAGLTKQWLLDVLNYDLTDVLTDLGLRTRGGEFSFAAPKTRTSPPGPALTKRFSVWEWRSLRVISPRHTGYRPPRMASA